MSCKGKAGQAEADTAREVPADSIATVLEEPGDSTFFMLRDEKLPQKVDLNQDISHLSYQSLRLLRSYVYATHGHWFLEADLNSFFSNHTDWYVSFCYDKWDGGEIEPEAAAYLEALEVDYPKSYKLIKLSKEEQAFVDKIDTRMEELRTKKYVKGADDVLLLNAQLLINMHQIFEPDPHLVEMLSQYNVAFEPTTYQQLFNVYENNEYLSIPNFVTTDVMLQAYHMYFSYMLKSLEGEMMHKALGDAMAEMLKASTQCLEVCNDQVLEMDREIASFFAVGLKLLGHDPYELMNKQHVNLHEVLAGADKLVNQEVALVMACEDNISPLFKTDTYFNYSLFKPRGHYTRNTQMQQYFRAMMWLQKGCWFREKSEQLETAIRIAQLLHRTPTALHNLKRIDTALRFLMGQPDNVSLMNLAEKVGTYQCDLIVSGTPEFKEINQWLVKQFKQSNRIGPKEKQGPQDQLNVMPQRYMLDSDILGTMYDPLPNAKRAYPSGLDVMDLLGVKSATALLADVNKQQPWADYDKERKQMAARVQTYQKTPSHTMYDAWMQSLVKLQHEDKSQPCFMHTQAWRLKNLNTALASWALLKHDALLYAEEPIAAECGSGGLPEPVVLGYVEPNMAFWKEMKAMLKKGQDMLQATFPSEDLQEKAKELEGYVDLCIRFSKAEVSGAEIGWEDEYAVRSIGSSLEWFTLSVVDPFSEIGAWDDLHGPDRCVAQVADVFTRNILGCNKDGILYEATGLPNAIYVVVERDGQLMISRGATYSYHEFVRPLGDRLTDEQWQDMLFKGKAPAQPTWFQPFLLGKPVDVDERFVFSTGC